MFINLKCILLDNKMTSMQGFMDGSYGMRQMYNKFRCKEKPVLDYTILQGLSQNPMGKQFLSLITDLTIRNMYNSAIIPYTLFVPVDINTKGMDSYETRRFLLGHTCNHQLNFSFLKSSKGMYINSMIPDDRILVENVSKDTTDSPLINSCSKIIGIQYIGKSCIYYLDKDFPINLPAY